MSGYIASSTGTSPSFEIAPPPTQYAPYPTQFAEGEVLPVPPQTQTEDDDDDSVSEINSETKPRGVKRSWVWDHFITYEDKKHEKKKDATGKIIEVEVVHKRAKCVYCPKGPLGDYAVDSGKNGTSGMLNHIRKYCRYYPANVDKTQKIISGDKSQGNKLVARGFVQTDVLEACAEMIIIDELPFSFVEKKGFRKFCSVACPLFNVPSRRTIVRQFLKMYDEQRLKLKKDLRETRVCLTTDTWTSVQNCNYMVLTAHFIDSEWKMHKRVLNFCVISNHQGSTIGKLIENCLLEWGIEKVLAITVDNASANKVAINWVRSKLNRRAKAEPVLQGKYLHVRCLAHITNLIVVSGLKRLSKSILAIRNAVRYVRSSPQRLEFFKTCVEAEGLSLNGMVCMDVPTRWNSTFIMLDSALKYKKAFVRMGEDEDSPFLAYFKEPEHEVDEDGVIVSNTKHIRAGPPSEDDWENATVFVKFLRVFYEVTLKVSASLHPTVNKAFHSILAIEKEIDKLFVLPEMATGSEAEKVLIDMASKMREKYNKYFVKFEDMNVLLVVAIVLDPRFKLRHVTHLFKKEKFDDAEVEKKTTTIKEVLMSMYEEYAPRLDGGIHMRGGNVNSAAQTVNASSEDVDDIMDDWIKVVEESEEAVVAHEVDTYLHDPLELTTKEVFFDILLWWKLNGPKYPVLAAIAKDILAIQVSTVAFESCFSTGGRVIDAFRSSLTPRSVEALICMQNWLKGDDICTNLEDEPTPEEYEFYESVELEYASTEAAATSTNTFAATSTNTFGVDPKGKGHAI